MQNAKPNQTLWRYQLFVSSRKDQNSTVIVSAFRRAIAIHKLRHFPITVSVMAKELHLHAGGDLDTLLEEIREAQSANLENLTLYNLDLSLEVANALIDLIRAQLQRRLVSSNWKDDSGREAQPLLSSFTLEILGGKGFVDRIVEAYVGDHRISSEENDVKRELILVHSHPDGFDTSVFAALGMALDGRRAKYATESLGLLTPKLRLSLYQPVLSDTKTWTLAQGIGESCCLQELDLSSNSFDPLIGSRMIQNLAESLQRNKHLVCLRFKNCCLVDEQIVSLMGGLRGHPTLQQLELTGNKCRSSGLVAIASALSFTSAQSDHAGAKLPAFSLDLANQHINKQNQSLLDDSMFQAWSRHRSFTDRLETLNLSGNKLDDADLSMVVSLLLPNTTESEQQDSSPSHLRG